MYADEVIPTYFIFKNVPLYWHNKDSMELP